MFMHQDSGTTSYGIQADGERWFVKQSTDPSIVESLRRAVQLHTTVQHDALPSLRNTFEIPNGLALVYEWVPGEVLNDPRFTREQRRHDSAHPHVRFRSLPLRQVVDALDTVYDVHLVLAERGFVASDFYDGCIIYDFDGEHTVLCDLDEYRDGPFVLETDRAYGSTRFMAPEEFQRGATIDQVSNVFNLGRAATVLLGDGTESLDAWKGSEAMKKVVARATDPDRDRRHQCVHEFVDEWRAAVGGLLTPAARPVDVAIQRMTDPNHAAGNGEEVHWRDNRGQDIVSSWHPPVLPPPVGTRWGAAGICFTRDGELVLVKESGFWVFPGGRPEEDEEWRATMDREVLEEACASVEEATLLGFTRGECVKGGEKGLVLVRSLWRAEVSLKPWEPQHETTDRLVVPSDQAFAILNFPQGSRPIIQRWFDEALAV